MPSATKKVSLVRRSEGHYTATNARGGQIRFGAGKDAEFTPVELLLAAIGGCSSIDVDTVTSRRGGPTQFTVSVSGTKRSDEEGRASLGDVAVDFQLSFPDTEEGREAAGLVNRVVTMSRDKNCTVSRTVEAQTPVAFSIAGEPLD